MRLFFLITIVAGFVTGGCRSPYFKYVDGIDTTGTFDEYIVDSSQYNLYVKSVCIDGNRKPFSCQGAEGEEVIEREYLLVSRDCTKVLVINNMVNRNQKIFNDPSRVLKVNATNDDQAEINIWFFKQFRFGTIEENSTLRQGYQFKFRTVEKHPVTYVWHYTMTDDSVTVSAIGKQQNDGIDLLFTKPALYLEPRFDRAKDFLFVFQIPQQRKRNSSRVELAEAKWRIRKNCTYFGFDEPVLKNHKAIRFGRKRMYAYTKQ